MLNIGTRFKLIREINNLSPDNLADLLHVSVPTYRRLESGERQPKIEEIKILCETFNLELDFFLSPNSPVYQNNTNKSNGYINSIVSNSDAEIVTNLKKCLEILLILLEKEKSK